LETLDQSIISSIHLYGHSLGGFVSLGLQNSRNQGWWKDKIGTVILESPMTALAPIIEQRAGLFSPLLPLMKRWLMQGFVRIHPEFEGCQWTDIDVPGWGMPSCPVLIMQAKNDAQLGQTHYDSLMSCIGEIEHEAHIIPTLSHTQNQVNKERDELISNWIDKRIN
jgi:alpha-beta hydrolase superfamily lysophospholipase